jgi:hypothetical protein
MDEKEKKRHMQNPYAGSPYGDVVVAADSMREKLAQNLGTPKIKANKQAEVVGQPVEVDQAYQAKLDAARAMAAGAASKPQEMSPSDEMSQEEFQALKGELEQAPVEEIPSGQMDQFLMDARRRALQKKLRGF